MLLSPQYYLGKFSVDFAAKSIAPARWIGVSDTRRRILAVLEVTFKAFVEDVRAAVIAGVESEINPILENSDNYRDVAPAVQRREYLERWADQRHPLSYGGHNRIILVALIRAVCPDMTIAFDGLPKSARGQWAITDFIKTLHDMARPNNPIRPASPIIPGGGALGVFKAALDYAYSIGPSPPTHGHQSLILAAMRQMTQELHIQFVPDTPHRDGPRRGPAPRHPRYNAWSTLGAPDAMVARPAPIAMEDTDDVRIARSAAAIMANDVRAPWALDGLRIQNFKDFLDREVPPTTWHIPRTEANDETYIGLTFTWAYDYACNNIGDYRTQLAIILAFIVSRLCPDVHWDPNEKKNMTKDNQPYTTDFVRKVKWISRDDRHGMSDIGTYFTQLATYILAILHSDSPLRQYMNIHNSSTGPFGQKYSTFSASHLLHKLIYESLTCALSQPPRQLLHFNLFVSGSPLPGAGAYFMPANLGQTGSWFLQRI